MCALLCDLHESIRKLPQNLANLAETDIVGVAPVLSMAAMCLRDLSVQSGSQSTILTRQVCWKSWHTSFQQRTSLQRRRSFH